MGMGVDENALISTLGKSQKEHRKLFRKASKSFFVEDEERAFEKCHDHFVRHLKLEFSRFNVSSFLPLIFFPFLTFSKCFYQIKNLYFGVKPNNKWNHSCFYLIKV